MGRFLFFFAIAVLSGLGVGSAGIPVLYLTAVQGLPQLEAQGLNLVFFLFCSGAALLIHVLRIPLPRVYILMMIPAGLAGSFLGTALAASLPQALLRTLFGVFLIATGAMGLFKRRK